MFTCDRCKKTIDISYGLNSFFPIFVACESCNQEYIRGRELIRKELQKLGEERGLLWLSEWQKNYNLEAK